MWIAGLIYFMCFMLFYNTYKSFRGSDVEENAFILALFWFITVPYFLIMSYVEDW